MGGDLGEKRLGCIHGCLPGTFPLTCWEAVHKCKNLLSACHIAECHSNVSDFSVFVLSAAEISMARPLQIWSAPGISWQLVSLVFGANSAHFSVDPAHCSGQKKPSLDIAFGLDTWKPQILLFWAQKLILFAQECLCACEAGAAWGRMSSCDVLWWKSGHTVKEKRSHFIPAKPHWGNSNKISDVWPREWACWHKHKLKHPNSHRWFMRIPHAFTATSSSCPNSFHTILPSESRN